MTTPTQHATPADAELLGQGPLSLDRFWRLAYRQLVLQVGSGLPDPGMDPAVADHALSCECRGWVWRLCPTPDDCLTIALLVDDPVPYVAGVSRAERAALFARIEAAAVELEPWLHEHHGHAGQED